MEAPRTAFDEAITLRHAKKLIQCMAHEQSFLLLSAPGMGKSEMVYEAAREAGLPCRSLLGTQIAPEDVSGVPRIVGERSVFCPPRISCRNDQSRSACSSMSCRPAHRTSRRRSIVIARTPARRARAPAGNLGGCCRQSPARSRSSARDEFCACQSSHHTPLACRYRRMARLGRSFGGTK